MDLLRAEHEMLDFVRIWKINLTVARHGVATLARSWRLRVALTF